MRTRYDAVTNEPELERDRPFFKILTFSFFLTLGLAPMAEFGSDTARFVDIEDLGKANFDAYRASKNGVTYDGKPIPEWADLTDDVRQGWRDGARAVFDLTRGNVQVLYH